MNELIYTSATSLAKVAFVSPAQPHGATLAREMAPAFSYTSAYNLTGWPGVVVRAGTSPKGVC